MRMRPNHEEAVELIRHRYTILEQLPSSGKRGLKRSYEDAAAAVSAPIKQTKLELAPVQERAAKSLVEQRNRLKQAFELKEKFDAESEKALCRNRRTDAVYREMLEVKKAADAAFK
jgi:hypothetical protein